MKKTWQEKLEDKASLPKVLKLEKGVPCYNAVHKMGLFKLETWLNLFKRAAFDTINQVSMNYTYDRFLTGEGKYPRLLFVCRKQF